VFTIFAFLNHLTGPLLLTGPLVLMIQAANNLSHLSELLHPAK
jgi:hypothetical protein